MHSARLRIFKPGIWISSIASHFFPGTISQHLPRQPTPCLSEGGRAAATPLPTAYFLTGRRKAENTFLKSAWRRLASLPHAQGNERSWEQLPLTTSLIPCSSPSAGSDVSQPHLSPPWAKAMPAPHTCWRLPHILRESPEGDLQVLHSLQRVQATNQPGKLDP